MLTLYFFSKVEAKKADPRDSRTPSVIGGGNMTASGMGRGMQQVQQQAYMTGGECAIAFSSYSKFSLAHFLFYCIKKEFVIASSVTSLFLSNNNWSVNGGRNKRLSLVISESTW